MRRMRRMHSQVLKESTESLADHSLQVAVIGLVLAEMEGADASKVGIMGVLHDLPELRTGDANYVHKKYVEQNERQAYLDQFSEMPGGEEIIKLLDEFNEGETLEAKVARDADLLGQICLQKEYLGKGYDFELWHTNSVRMLQTESAKLLAEEIKKRNPLQWVYNFADIPPQES